MRPDRRRPRCRRQNQERRRDGKGHDREHRLIGAFPQLVLGTQGWSYRDWVGTVYDSGSRPQDYLRQYARAFGSVEVDSTFYGTPAPEQCARWAQAVPPDFTFALKLTREITHERRLVGCADLLKTFFAAVEALGPKLEAVLVQLAPDFGPDEWEPLAAFVPLLPAGPRIALEVRDPRWFAGERRTRLCALLRAYGIALAVSDGTFVELNVMLAAFAQPTAPFTYVRWLGRRDSVTRFDQVSIDRNAQIARWSTAFTSIAARLERICGYANNHYMGHAPATVEAMYCALGIERATQPRIVQTELFANEYS